MGGKKDEESIKERKNGGKGKMRGREEKTG